MMDTDTSRNLCWQKEVSGVINKLAAWKVEVTSNPCLQFYPYMQPGEAYMVVGHSMSTIYSTTTDVASLHGKVVLFTGDRKVGRECIPVILPPPAAFAWNTCKAINNKSKLMAWYQDNQTEYGNLWDPTVQDGTKEDILVPQFIALPLQAAKLYHQLGGAVMPHELLNALESHLSGPDTSLDNGDDWGLVQKWLLVVAQKDGGNGDPNKSKSHIAFRVDALLSNDTLIHRWTSNQLDATLGRHPDPTAANTMVGMQGNKAVMQNMATEMGRGLGVAMQHTSKAGPAQSGGAGASEDAKPYTQDQIATLLGFHGAWNVHYLMKAWRLFKVSKTPTYDHLRRAIKAEMIRWADREQSWIKEGVYFDNKTINEWIALKFNPGDGIALYASSDKGISILKCRAPTSAILEV
jgi:hypothetical protein